MEFLKNPEFEKLKENKILSPSSLRGGIYRNERRNFLKGIIYADLCWILYKKIEGFAKKRKERLELLLIGGLAMSFYGLHRFTLDIDGEIDCKNEIYFFPKDPETLFFNKKFSHLLDLLKTQK